MLRPGFLCIGNGDQIVCFDAKTCEVITTVETSLGKNVTFLSSLSRDCMLVGTVDTVCAFSIAEDGRWRWQTSKTFNGDKLTCMTWLAPGVIGLGGWNRLRILKYEHGRLHEVGHEYAHEGNVVGVANLSPNDANRAVLSVATIGHDSVLKTWQFDGKTNGDSFDALFK